MSFNERTALIIFRRVPNHLIQFALAVATRCEVDHAITNTVANVIAHSPQVITAIAQLTAPGGIAAAASSAAINTILNTFEPQTQAAIIEVLTTCDIADLIPGVYASKEDYENAQRFVSNYKYD